MMKQYTLVIADGSEDFRRTLQLQFEPCCQVFCCSTGTEVLNLMQERHTDVLVLDLMLPGMDGLSLLSCFSAIGDCPEILALTAYVSPYILEAAQKLSVSVLMEKPCSLQKAEEAVRSLLQKKGERGDRFSRISGLLLRLGFTAKLRGYSYLRDAVLHYVKNPGQSVLKELYPAVAAVYGVTSEDVEHSIRSAVMDAWSRRVKDIWGNYFPLEEEKNLRPSNAAVIGAIAESVMESRELSVQKII